MIWALFAKQQGHQIASIIATCTRTDEEPCIPVPTRLFWGLYSLLVAAILEGLRGRISWLSYPDLADAAVWRNRRPLATTRASVPTLPSRAHPQDYGRRTTLLSVELCHGPSDHDP